MTSNTRSKRQVESLRRIREWHLESALRAQMDGRGDESRFHMHHYRLLGPAVEHSEPGIAGRSTLSVTGSRVD
ncbi:hypothetical protein NPS29_02740 [Pseudomonas putida]|uniref:hypothetical protein n=1 Tax=Pseudomonas putida TaxID=303 RepID=UPI0023644196|nr:hypothetical protein [Pseudomonas putida]MDD1964223.1 hypothetical protein [Pseudomonas putida]